MIAILGWLRTVSAFETTVPRDPGHLFIPIGKTYPSYSFWAVTISINIVPFRKQSTEVFVAQTKLDRLVTELRSSIGAYTNSSERAMLLMHVSHLEAALSELNGEAGGLKRTFLDLLYPKSVPDNSDIRDRRRARRRIKRVLPPHLEPLRRTKRGLVDGLGNAFNYLFGTATESEIKHLEKNVKLLNQKDLAIAHQFNGTRSHKLNSCCGKRKPSGA